MRPTWNPPGADRTQVGSMLVPCNLLSGTLLTLGYLLTPGYPKFIMSQLWSSKLNGLTAFTLHGCQWRWITAFHADIIWCCNGLLIVGGRFIACDHQCTCVGLWAWRLCRCREIAPTVKHGKAWTISGARLLQGMAQLPIIVANSYPPAANYFNLTINQCPY